MGHLLVPEAEKLLDKDIAVLDKGFIRLIDYMGGDARIVQTARVSYGSGTKTAREDAALIDYLIRNRHTSPFEHVVLEIHCKMPIFVARQWIRHRTARLNEMSARYSVMQDEFYVPPPEQIRRQALNNKQGRADESVPPELQQKVLEILRRDQSAAYASYQEMLQDDIARELARINLPTSLYTQWYWQMDLHNLLHFIALRIDPHAQWEIRQYARALLKLARAVAPMAVASFERHEMNGCRLSVDEVQAVKRILKGEPNPLSGRKLDEFNRKFLAESDGAPPKLRELSRDEINRLPLRCYEGPISVIAEGEALRKAIQELRTEKVLGFDTETRPAFQKGESYPPALIQLAGSQKAYIFQLQALAGCEALMEILADPAIVKAGVAHKRDVEDLARLYPFQPAGFIDLADLSSRAGIAHNGLRGIAAAALGFRMSKREQRSNWARKDLTESQIRYAATDAWVGREIYLALAPKSRAGG